MDFKELYLQRARIAGEIGLNYSTSPIGRVHASICLTQDQSSYAPNSSEFNALEAKINNRLMLAFKGLPLPS